MVLVSGVAQWLSLCSAPGTAASPQLAQTIRNLGAAMLPLERLTL